MLKRVSTRGYRQSAHELRCNGLLYSFIAQYMIGWRLCSKVWVAREGKRAELWLVRKRYILVGETDGGDVDVTAVWSAQYNRRSYSVSIWVFRLDSGLA